MTKVTRKKKSTKTSNPISSRTRLAATNLLAITNTSSGSSRTTNTSSSSSRTTNTSSSSSRKTPNALKKQIIPMKKNISIWSFPNTPHSYRHIRLTSRLF